ncbi:MAG: 16S rRNA (guanine(527)-N(7))-methyltransferase RsmG [Rhodospirillales bacterium]|nr:16S rRNA (guanine(527)-N(7))-methyltransferase RsmG [Rhodospirillales bacterium]
MDRLAAYLALLRQWQPRINLVGRSTLADAWRRHILDATQLEPLLPKQSGAVFDLGSGAGIPGLILAVTAGLPLTLVDSDSRKCAFLREAARVTRAPVTVTNARIESLPRRSASLVMARALAPLDRMLPLIWPILRDDSTVLLLKGKRLAEELTDAGKTWKMKATSVPSRTDPHGSILLIQEIEPRYGE